MTTVLESSAISSSLTLLQVCHNVCDATGFRRPANIAGSADQTARQLLVLMNEAGEQLSKERNWSELVTEYTFSLLTGVQDYTLPADFRWIVPMTTWDRSSDRLVINPVSGEEWQFMKAWTTISGLHRKARIRGGVLEFEANMTSADNAVTIAFEYLSSYWCSTSGGTAKSRMTIDTDIGRLDSHLLELGLMWRFRRAKGLSWETEQAEYQRQVMLSKAGDGGARRLNMGRSTSVVPNNPNVPESGYGV